MNICYVAHLGDLSGANRSLIDLICAVRKHGVNVFVIVPRQGELSRRLDELGIENKCIFSGSWLGNRKKEKNIKKIIKILVNILAEYRFYRFFKKNKNVFNVIHYNSIIYGVGAKSLDILNLPYVWHIREFPEENFGLTYYNKSNSYKLLSKSKVIFAISNAIYKHFSQDFDENKISLVYNGLNINSFKNQSYIRTFSLKKISILLVGAIAEDKGQLEAIKAIAYLVSNKNITNISLNIVGKIIDHDYFKILNDYIINEKLNEYVIFHGYFSDISPFRERCEIALVSSKMEAFGRVTVEAMLSKELVIGANTGGTSEIIDHLQTGLLYEQGDIYSLANTIEYAIENLDEIEKIIEKAFGVAKYRFNIDRVANEVIEQYAKVRRSI